MRILELRDRIRTAAAPFLYAQLAEEYRRARDVEEAITTCRECLAKYPAYLSVRVILGRALAERGDLDAAAGEFTQVLSSAPDNLTATRDLAEVELRLGRLDRALEHFGRALVLVRSDAELEARVESLTRMLAAERAADGAHTPPSAGPSATARDTAAAAAPAGSPPPAVDLDAILTSLGANDQRLPPLMEMLLAPAPQAPDPSPAGEKPSVPEMAQRADHAALVQLESWLAAIERRRVSRPPVEQHANRPA